MIMSLKKFLIRCLRLKKDFASLTVVGVGPGDPSLLTIAAVEAIKNSKVVVFPISSFEKRSFSAEIVQKYIKFKKKIPIIFPMARKEFDPDEIWSNAVEIIVKIIKNKQSVVLLCLGDTSLFASSSNILRIMHKRYPELKTKVIPGISSLSASAAFINFDLAKKGETLVVKECPSSKSELTELIIKSKLSKTVLAIMKVGKRWRYVKQILKSQRIINKSFIALNVGMHNQIIKNASAYMEEDMPYFSTILIRFD